jgi:hypothetical protein
MSNAISAHSQRIGNENDNFERLRSLRWRTSQKNMKLKNGMFKKLF